MAGRNYTHTGVWDQVLAFGQYQHATIDGEPVLTVFDASKCAAMLDDFAAHPENDIFYDKQHEIVDALGDKAMDRAEMKAWGDGHAMAWANALCMVVGGKVVRYEPHPGAPAQQPHPEDLRQSDGIDRGDGVYALRCEITPRGADPSAGLAAFRYTSPYFVPERDGWRLLNLTATNDPRMRGAALAMGRDGQRVSMSPAKGQEMNEIRIGDRVEVRSKSGDYLPGTVIKRQGNFYEVRLETGEIVLTIASEMNTFDRTKEIEMNAGADDKLMARAGCMADMTPAAQIEKMAAYIRKMEDEGKKKDEDAEIVMDAMRSVKMDVDPSNWAQNAAVHIKTGNSHDGKGDTPIKSKYLERMESGDEEKTAMQAMQRRLDAQAAQIDALTSAIKAERTERESLSKQAMERKAREEKAEAAQWADAALRNGQWNPMHAGGKSEQDPSKAVAMTRDWLESKYLAGQKDILLPEGTFKPSEAQVMQRYTQGGSVPGSPDPREGTAPSPDERLDALLSAEIRAAKAKGQTLSMQQAMGRVKASNPELHRAWASRPGRLA